MEHRSLRKTENMEHQRRRRRRREDTGIEPYRAQLISIRYSTILPF